MKKLRDFLKSKKSRIGLATVGSVALTSVVAISAVACANTDTNKEPAQTSSDIANAIQEELLSANASSSSSTTLNADATKNFSLNQLQANQVTPSLLTGFLRQLVLQTNKPLWINVSNQPQLVLASQISASNLNVANNQITFNVAYTPLNSQSTSVSSSQVTLTGFATSALATPTDNFIAQTLANQIKQVSVSSNAKLNTLTAQSFLDKTNYQTNLSELNSAVQAALTNNTSLQVLNGGSSTSITATDLTVSSVVPFNNELVATLQYKTSNNPAAQIIINGFKATASASDVSQALATALQAEIKKYGYLVPVDKNYVANAVPNSEIANAILDAVSSVTVNNTTINLVPSDIYVYSVNGQVGSGEIDVQFSYQNQAMQTVNIDGYEDFTASSSLQETMNTNLMNWLKSAKNQEQVVAALINNQNASSNRFNNWVSDVLRQNFSTFTFKNAVQFKYDSANLQTVNGIQGIALQITLTGDATIAYGQNDAKTGWSEDTTLPSGSIIKMVLPLGFTNTQSDWAFPLANQLVNQNGTAITWAWPTKPLSAPEGQTFPWTISIYESNGTTAFTPEKSTTALVHIPMNLQFSNSSTGVTSYSGANDETYNAQTTVLKLVLSNPYFDNLLPKFNFQGQIISSSSSSNTPSNH